MQRHPQIKFMSFDLFMVKRLLVLLCLITVIGCQEGAQDNPEPIDNSLTCPSCEEIDVIEVIDGNSVSTSIGEIKLYGAYVLDQPADCADEAKTRLGNLAATSIRIENGPADSVRRAENYRYVYTANGQSIEQALIEEGLALTWTQDGQHLGWFLFKDAQAKERESGCLWHDYQAFLRDEPNEFRIPGLTYPDQQ